MHGGIRTERHRGTGVVQGTVRVGAAGAALPTAFGDIAVVHRLLGLHARRNPELREPREVDLAQQLRSARARPVAPVAANASSAEARFASSPIACTAAAKPPYASHFEPADQLIRRHLRASRNRSSGYGSQQYAVRQFGDPSVMILNGPTSSKSPRAKPLDHPSSIARSRQGG